MNPSVQFPEDQVEETRMNLPGMMFADGEEPVGVRVLTYQSSRAINSILSALDEEEIQFIRQSSFGKLVDIGDKPGFSGRFARFLLSRQLKVEKKYEDWFRFVGKPIRFSLWEFAIVTGLPCGEFPKKQKLKKKKKITVGVCDCFVSSLSFQIHSLTVWWIYIWTHRSLVIPMWAKVVWLIVWNVSVQLVYHQHLALLVLFRYIIRSIHLSPSLHPYIYVYSEFGTALYQWSTSVTGYDNQLI